MTRIILVRHGETPHNAVKISQGWLNSELSEKGRKQAFRTGKALKKEKISIIYCSDLLRTKQTAEEILKSIEAGIEYVEWLREKNLGEFEGKPEGKFLEHVKANNLDIFSFVPKGGESILQFRKRVKKPFDKLVKNNKHDTILLISHGGVITQLIMHALKIDDKEYDKYRTPNCAVTIFEINENKKITAKMINAVLHGIE